MSPHTLRLLTRSPRLSITPHLPVGQAAAIRTVAEAARTRAVLRAAHIREALPAAVASIRAAAIPRPMRAATVQTVVVGAKSTAKAPFPSNKRVTAAHQQPNSLS